MSSRRLQPSLPSGRARGIVLGWILGGLFLLSSGCRVRHPESFATPVEAVLSFQSAYAAGNVEGEYRCLSQGLKRSVNRQVYSTFRERFLEPLGPFGRAVLRKNDLGNNLEGEVRDGREATLFFEVLGHGFQILTVHEAYLEVTGSDAGSSQTAILEPGSVQVVGETEGHPLVSIQGEFPSDFVRGLLDQGVRCVTLEGRWKLEEVAVTSAAESGLVPPGFDSGAARELPVSQVPVRILAETLGYSRVEILLPLDADAHQALVDTGVPLTRVPLHWRVFPAR